MGHAPSLMSKINFEDVQLAIKRHDILINTLDAANQMCLILGTVAISIEEVLLNEHMRKDRAVTIILYGMNASDTTLVFKYDQLVALGFYNVHIYSGGLFEWLLLQDVYGFDAFPTTAKDGDILKYKGRSKLNPTLMLN